jgi:hypothetical protein
MHRILLTAFYQLIMFINRWYAEQCRSYVLCPGPQILISTYYIPSELKKYSLKLVIFRICFPSIWIRTRSSGEFLRKPQLTFGFHKTLGISSLAELLPSAPWS